MSSKLVYICLYIISKNLLGVSTPLWQKICDKTKNRKNETFSLQRQDQVAESKNTNIMCTYIIVAFFSQRLFIGMLSDRYNELKGLMDFMFIGCFSI